jgi:hypothetical protein
VPLPGKLHALPAGAMSQEYGKAMSRDGPPLPEQFKPF